MFVFFEVFLMFVFTATVGKFPFLVRAVNFFIYTPEPWGWRLWHRLIENMEMCFFFFFPTWVRAKKCTNFILCGVKSKYLSSIIIGEAQEEQYVLQQIRPFAWSWQPKYSHGEQIDYRAFGGRGLGLLSLLDTTRTWIPFGFSSYCLL